MKVSGRQNGISPSPQRDGTRRFVNKYASHKRLRLLFEGLDAAEAIMDGTEIIGSSDEADKAFSFLRRGALDAIRLKDEEGAFDEYFVPLTKNMARQDITLLWTYLLDYIKKRGRPISKRPILEAIAAFIELALSSPWRVILDELLPSAGLTKEYDAAFKQEVVLKPRDVRPRDERKASPATSETGTKSTTQKKAFGQMDVDFTPGFRPAPADAMSRTTVATNSGSRSSRATPPSFRTTFQSGRSSGSTARPQSVPSPKIKDNLTAKPLVHPASPITKQNSGGFDCWWDSPAVPNLEPRRAIPSPKLSQEDCWWLNSDSSVTDSPAIFNLKGDTTQFPTAPIIGTVQGSFPTTMTSVPEGGFPLPIPSQPQQQPQIIQAAVTTVATGTIIPGIARVTNPSALSNGPILTACVVTSTDTSPTGSAGGHGAPTTNGHFIPKAQPFFPNHVQTNSFPQMNSAPGPLVTNGNIIQERPGINHMQTNSFPQMNASAAPVVTNPFADLGKWCEEEVGTSPFVQASKEDSPKKKKKKKKNEKELDDGDVPKLRAPKSSGKARASIGSAEGSNPKSLFDDKTFPMFT